MKFNLQAFGEKRGPGAKFSAVLAVLTLLSVVMLVLEVPSAAADDAALPFANDAFQATWERTDKPINQGKAARSWYWGLNPLTISLSEAYAESPGKEREVQYFDKARMEINDPSKGTVTNGLLVVELINGRRQEGDKLYVEAGPAVIPIAGDSSNTWPTYAGLGGVYLKSLDTTTGQAAQVSWNPEGKGVQAAYKNDAATKIATKQNGMGIPAAFWDFLNRKGTVYLNGEYKNDTVSDWLFSTGLPITEAYWTRVKVGGVEKDVLFQAFERRTLTYTPANSAEYRVEMGNVGWHYLMWRYPKGVPQVSDPVANVFLGTQPDWYEVTGDALNVRTGPGTKYPVPERTATKPYLQQLVKGNHVQPIRSVKGEAIEKGNDVWFQFYENPDLFVYSGYVKKLTLPSYPTPPHTYKGVWVSVDLTKQMMAVFDGKRLLYKTFIASGVPNDTDPDKDHRTPAGVFKIDGSYRPASQTMEGGAGDKAAGGDYYKLEEIRNVSYFYQDYSIHGTYWHARFGTYPQSHGCVNATVYDAGLIYKLKAGTTVETFRETSSTTSSQTDNL
jgi:hypothetical protein